jgi:transcriptional regulator with XRE-family HTH domain
MKRASYVNLYGESIWLDGLDAEELALVNRLRRRARTKPGWSDFSNFASKTVNDFYDRRGISREESGRSPAFDIAVDLSNRLGIDEGKVEPPTFDYREQLERLVLQYPTRRAFCKAAGISQDMLSHVLAGRKDLSLETLARALNRLGYRLQFVRTAHAKRTA